MVDRHGYDPDPLCPHCKGSGGVPTGENEYSTCPCVEETQQIMRKNIDIPNEIVKDLKKLAVDADRDLKNYIQDLLVAHVKIHKVNGKKIIK